MTKTIYELNESSIDRASGEIQLFLDSVGMEKKNILRLRLVLEDALVKWLDGAEEGATFALLTGTRFGRPMITIKMKGREISPFDENDDDDFSPVTGRMMANMGLYPLYTYQNGRNQIQVKLKKKKRNPLVNLAISASIAVIVGILGYYLPEAIRTGIASNVLTPIYDTFLDVLSAIAGPMIFLSVAWGIYGIGDATTLGMIGKKILIRFCGFTLLITACSFFMILPFAGLTYTKGGIRASELNSIFELLLDIFPKDIASPFINGNTMQIILIATVIGCIMLILGNQTKAMAELIEQTNYVIQYLMELVGNLVPFLIFVVILQLIWSDAYSVVYTAWKPIFSFLIVTVMILCVILLYISVREKLSPMLLVRKLLPTFLIAVTTASSSASYGTIVNCCERQLGINSKLTSFGIPLGIVLYKPVTAINFVACALYFAQVYEVDISLAWMMTAIIVITFLTIALPPIPGGALACYTIMLSQLGIPLKALELIMILDIFYDFLATGFGMTYLQCELLMQAESIRLLDKKILRKKH